jgi:hypothetical protein
MFQKNRLHPSSESCNKPAEACGRPASVEFLTYSSTLKMGAISSSETPGSLQTTLRYNPEYYTLHSHRHKNLKSYVLNSIITHLLEINVNVLYWLEIADSYGRFQYSLELLILCITIFDVKF